MGTLLQRPQTGSGRGFAMRCLWMLDTAPDQDIFLKWRGPGGGSAVWNGGGKILRAENVFRPLTRINHKPSAATCGRQAGTALGSHCGSDSMFSYSPPAIHRPPCPSPPRAASRYEVCDLCGLTDPQSKRAGTGIRLFPHAPNYQPRSQRQTGTRGGPDSSPDWS